MINQLRFFFLLAYFFPLRAKAPQPIPLALPPTCISFVSNSVHYYDRGQKQQRILTKKKQNKSI